MTTTDPGRCDACGRQRWPGDRFCAGCGVENSEVANDDAPLIDLDNDVSQTEAVPAKSSRRESLVGIAALVAVLGFIALLFVFGNDAAEDLARPDNPFPTGTPTAVPTATPTPIADDPVSGVVAEIGTDDQPPTTATPRPTPRPLALDLAEFATSLDLGGGWMIVAFNDHIAAVDVQTGEVIEIPKSTGQFAETYVLASGVLSTGSGRSWTYDTWTSDNERQQSTGGDGGGDAPLVVFADPSVGPVVVTLEFDDRPTLMAMAVLTGESQEIMVTDVANAVFSNFAFAPGQLKTGRAGFFSDDGQAVYSWTWDQQWTQITTGQVVMVEDTFAAVTRCVDLIDCPAVFVDTTGQELAAIGSGRLPTSFGLPQLISPDLTRYVRLAPNGGATPLLTIADFADGAETRVTGETGLPWTEVWAWSPNGEFLFGGTNTLHALHIETGETTTFSSADGGNPQGVVFLSEIDR